jgi:hypothetical protein
VHPWPVVDAGSVRSRGATTTLNGSLAGEGGSPTRELLMTKGIPVDAEIAACRDDFDSEREHVWGREVQLPASRSGPAAHG